jgi:hypothetical protein
MPQGERVADLFGQPTYVFSEEDLDGCLMAEHGAQTES